MITVVLGSAALLTWIGFELLFRAPGEAARWRGGSQDRASTPILVLAFAIATIVPFLLRDAAFGSIGRAAWAGVVLSALGLALRAWSMRTLGASYTRTLRTDAGQTLVTAGPYNWIRHPGYAGSIAVWTGAALAFHSWFAAVLVAALMLAAYSWRISAEEKMLSVHFGEQYRAYSARTRRLIPGLY